MTKAELYNNIVQSVIKFIGDFMVDNDLTLADNYVDWDAHSQIHELPNSKTLVGPAGIGMMHEMDDDIQVVFSVGVCTEDDQNLFRLRSLMSKLYGALAPQTRVTLYDHATSTIATWMVVAPPVSITPVTKAETRSLQFIQVRAMIDPGATSSLR